HLRFRLAQGSTNRLAVRAAEVAQHAPSACGQCAAHPVHTIELEAMANLAHHVQDVRSRETGLEFTFKEYVVHAGATACSAIAACACWRAQAATPCLHKEDMAANSAAITPVSEAARAARYKATWATSISVGRCSSSAQDRAS